jgi:hypothetical protein
MKEVPKLIRIKEGELFADPHRWREDFANNPLHDFAFRWSGRPEPAARKANNAPTGPNRLAGALQALPAVPMPPFYTEATGRTTIPIVVAAHII